MDETLKAAVARAAKNKVRPVERVVREYGGEEFEFDFFKKLTLTGIEVITVAQNSDSSADRKQQVVDLLEESMTSESFELLEFLVEQKVIDALEELTDLMTVAMSIASGRPFTNASSSVQASETDGASSTGTAQSQESMLPI